MTPRHHLRASLLTRRLRARGLAVEREGRGLRVTGLPSASAGIVVRGHGRPLRATLSTFFCDHDLFADSPAELAALIAAELLPSPTA